MEITNELWKRVFAAYSTAQIVHPHPNDIYTLYKIDFEHGICDLVRVSDGIIYRSRVLSTCKLILSPLSSITDEHKRELARIRFGSTEPSAKQVQMITEWIRVDSILSIDYLRSKSYNCGYGPLSPDDLTTFGLAIKMPFINPTSINEDFTNAGVKI